MDAKQLFDRPGKAVGFGAVPIDEVEGLGLDASPCVVPKAGARIAVR
jgi:hypothetical protein